MAQNYQPPKWMVFLLNMIISVGHLVPYIILSHCHIPMISSMMTALLPEAASIARIAEVVGLVGQGEMVGLPSSELAEASSVSGNMLVIP